MKRSCSEMSDDDGPFLETALETTSESILKILNGPSMPTCYRGQSDFLESAPSNSASVIIWEYRNFEPKRILRQLTRQAAASGTSPEYCAEEISNLIISRFCARNARKRSVPVKHEEWYKDLLKLEEKYDVKYDFSKSNRGHDPDTITFKRLCFMFPHVSIMAKAEHFDQQIVICGDKVPKNVHFEEFGGLIPSSQFLRKDVREGIILIHLYCLANNFPYIRSHFLQVFLKRMMNNGILVDERRIHYLKVQDIIEPNGDLSFLMEKLVRNLKNTCSNFISCIHWSLLN